MPGMDVDPAGSESPCFAVRRRPAGNTGWSWKRRALPYEVIELDGEWVLLVAAAAADDARDELARYAAERRVARDEPPTVIPFGGAGLGAAVYAGVLLLMAYCAGIQWLGMDWLASGALQPVAGAGAWWRAVAALTLHVDQAHLLGNLMFGVGIGILAGRVFGPGLAWASIRRGRRGRQLPGYADLSVDTSRGGRIHRRVCRLGAARRLFMAPAAQPAGAVQVSLGVLCSQACACWAFWAPAANTSMCWAMSSDSRRASRLGWVYARARVPRSRGYALQLGAGGAALGLVVAAWILALRHGVPAP